MKGVFRLSMFVYVLCVRSTDFFPFRLLCLYPVCIHMFNDIYESEQELQYTFPHLQHLIYEKGGGSQMGEGGVRAKLLGLGDLDK